MNGRLLALLGAIVLFVCLWSSQPADRSGNAPGTVPTESQTLPAQIDPRENIAGTAPAVPALSQSSTALVREPHWIGETLPVPVPPDLLPGQYRVVNGQGALGEVVVPGTVLGATPQELTVVRDGEVTWYFILQNSPRLALAAPSPLAATLASPPPCQEAPEPVEELVRVPAPDSASVAAVEMNSKERDILEAQVRQWMREAMFQLSQP